MADPSEMLSPAALKTYRNVRAIAVLYILIGGILFLAGTLNALGVKGDQPDRAPVHPAVLVLIAVVGLAGLVASRYGSGTASGASTSS